LPFCPRCQAIGADLDRHRLRPPRASAARRVMGDGSQRAVKAGKPCRGRRGPRISRDLGLAFGSEVQSMSLAAGATSAPAPDSIVALNRNAEADRRFTASAPTSTRRRPSFATRTGISSRQPRTTGGSICSTRRHSAAPITKRRWQ
jgi:hypothetical protein